MYTAPVSLLSPGADTNKYLGSVSLVLSGVGSLMACDHPKFMPVATVLSLVGGFIVLSSA
jgi:hypothetical protein